MAATKPCARCHEAPRTSKSYCGPCKSRLELEARKRRGATAVGLYSAQGTECSKAPPPPPGFCASDLTTARPWA